MISLAAAVSLIVYIIVAGVVYSLLFWLIDYAALREPFDKVAHVVLVVLAVLTVIGILISLVNGQPLFRA